MERFALADYKIFDLDERRYLFVVPQNAIFEADTDTVKVLRRTAERCDGRSHSREELMHWLPGSPSEKQETFDQLQRCGLFHPAPKQSLPKPDSSRQPQMPVKTLVLQVTDACNLSCRYCYYHSEGKSAAGARMTPEVARGAVDFLMEVSGNLDKVELVFFGGEPLLNVTLIAEVVDYARRAAARRGKMVDFALTTNATLLTEKTVAFLTQHRIGVTVSIDGLPRVHNRFRQFPDGSPSFEVILPGIQRLLSAPASKPVVARVTVAGDPNDVPASLDYLIDLGFAEAGFAPVTTANPAFRLDAGGMKQLLNQFELLSERFLDLAREDKLLGFTNLIDLLVTLHEGEVRSYPCGAGLGLFSVSTDGSIYLCQRLTGEDQAAMGSIFDGIDAARLEAFRRSGHLSSKPECRKCWAQVICAGGCYHEALVREGELTAANLHYCRWIQRWIETGLKIYGRLHSEKPDYLDKLSALRGHETRYNQVI
jgi:uncharacterized protein